MNSVRFWACYVLVGLISYGALRMQRFDVIPMTGSFSHFTVGIDRWTGTVSTGAGPRLIETRLPQNEPDDSQTGTSATGVAVFAFLAFGAGLAVAKWRFLRQALRDGVSNRPVQPDKY